MNRLKCNLEILKALTKIVKSRPNWRFHQMLCNIGMHTPGELFYEESSSTLTKLTGEVNANRKNS
jgi:hypothetical protein